MEINHEIHIKFTVNDIKNDMNNILNFKMLETLKFRKF